MASGRPPVSCVSVTNCRRPYSLQQNIANFFLETLQEQQQANLRNFFSVNLLAIVCPFCSILSILILNFQFRYVHASTNRLQSHVRQSVLFSQEHFQPFIRAG